MGGAVKYFGELGGTTFLKFYRETAKLFVIFYLKYANTMAQPRNGGMRKLFTYLRGLQTLTFLRDRGGP